MCDDVDILIKIDLTSTTDLVLMMNMDNKVTIIAVIVVRCIILFSYLLDDLSVSVNMWHK